MATLTMYRGDDKSWTVTILNSSGGAMDLEDCTVWWTMKKSTKDADAAAIIKHYWTEAAESGLSRTHPTTGVVAALSAGILYNTVTDTESAALELPYIYPVSGELEYVYDVQLKDANGLISTVETGTLTVTLDVTQRITTP